MIRSAPITALDEPGREGVPEGVIGGATVPFDLSRVLLHPAHPIALRIAAVLRLRGVSSSPSRCPAPLSAAA